MYCEDCFHWSWLLLLHRCHEVIISTFGRNNQRCKAYVSLSPTIAKTTLSSRSEGRLVIEAGTCCICKCMKNATQSLEIPHFCLGSVYTKQQHIWGISSLSFALLRAWIFNPAGLVKNIKNLCGNNQTQLCFLQPFRDLEDLFSIDTCRVWSLRLWLSSNCRMKSVKNLLGSTVSEDRQRTQQIVRVYKLLAKIKGQETPNRQIRKRAKAMLAFWQADGEDSIEKMQVRFQEPRQLPLFQMKVPANWYMPIILLSASGRQAHWG